ncbi:MAG: aminoacyl-tRNA hydrolase [Candidatus Omnitrophica bacterium]|nr:aminoacyl-tRNA hydrolase [Candidatus Omnitrophota bacterium]
MKLIVGLGNPGRIYLNSRHNIGFSAVKLLGRSFKISLKKDAGTFSLSGKGRIGNQNIILALPLSFMNLSGLAASALMKKYKIDLEDLLVVCDDLDLELGRLKIRPFGSSGGHRGLASIIEHLNSDKFPRLRVGIGRPSAKTEASEYVLSGFTKREKQEVTDMLERACACCQSWAVAGIEDTMNIFNRSASTLLSASTRSILSERSESKE